MQKPMGADSADERGPDVGSNTRAGRTLRLCAAILCAGSALLGGCAEFQFPGTTGGPGPLSTPAMPPVQSASSGTAPAETIAPAAPVAAADAATPRAGAAVFPADPVPARAAGAEAAAATPSEPGARAPGAVSAPAPDVTPGPAAVPAPPAPPVAAPAPAPAPADGRLAPAPVTIQPAPHLGIGAPPAVQAGPPANVPFVIPFDAGVYKCELGRSVNVREIAADRRTITLQWARKDYALAAVEARTGALRFEDAASGFVWIVIPAKAMLLDTRNGRQLANECRL